MANLLTLLRILLIFGVIAVWNRQIYPQWWQLDLLMVPLLAWAIIMDGLDGWVARRRRETSEAGALFDIAGDRIVELALWVFFAIRRDARGAPFVPMWVPLVMIARTVLTDLVRSAALRQGRTPFGEHTLQETWWAKELVSSRWSRAAYGVLKAVAFCALGIALAWERLRGFDQWAAIWQILTAGLVYVTVVFAVIRGLPVLWEGRRYILPARQTPAPAAERPRSSDLS